ncbi:MAG TPA: tautomerase family protein [Candidatus Binatia bacterium]|nr:tautomerase family protein [Candidatus Binatia bacterium]
MPTYTLMIPEDILSEEQKAVLAREITRLHSEATGAPRGFAQVFFHELPRGDHFVGGVAAQHGQIFVRGEIRAGRSREVKRRLIVSIQQETSRISELPQANVWVYLHELPSSQMAELGRILPEPGEEAAWIAALPPEEQARLHHT